MDQHEVGRKVPSALQSTLVTELHTHRAASVKIVTPTGWACSPMCSYHLPLITPVVTIYNQLPPCGKPGQQLALNPHN